MWGLLNEAAARVNVLSSEDRAQRLSQLQELRRDGEPQSLLYVAMSRARAHLIMLVQERARPAIAACVRRKLEESWNAHP
jgi:hypothetical protein